MPRTPTTDDLRHLDQVIEAAREAARGADRIDEVSDQLNDLAREVDRLRSDPRALNGESYGNLLVRIVETFPGNLPLPKAVIEALKFAAEVLGKVFAHFIDIKLADMRRAFKRGMQVPDVVGGDRDPGKVARGVTMVRLEQLYLLWWYQQGMPAGGPVDDAGGEADQDEKSNESEDPSESDNSDLEPTPPPVPRRNLLQRLIEFFENLFSSRPAATIVGGATVATALYALGAGPAWFDREGHDALVVLGQVGHVSEQQSAIRASVGERGLRANDPGANPVEVGPEIETSSAAPTRPENDSTSNDGSSNMTGSSNLATSGPGAATNSGPAPEVPAVTSSEATSPVFREDTQNQSTAGSNSAVGSPEAASDTGQGEPPALATNGDVSNETTNSVQTGSPVTESAEQTADSPVIVETGQMDPSMSVQVTPPSSASGDSPVSIDAGQTAPTTRAEVSPPASSDESESQAGLATVEIDQAAPTTGVEVNPPASSDESESGTGLITIDVGQTAPRTGVDVTLNAPASAETATSPVVQVPGATGRLVVSFGGPLQ